MGDVAAADAVTIAVARPLNATGPRTSLTKARAKTKIIIFDRAPASDGSFGRAPSAVGRRKSG